MYCRFCGVEISDNAKICPHCGVPVGAGSGGTKEKYDSLGCLLGGICFIAPLVGFILFAIWVKTKPKKASAAIIWAVIGLVVGGLLRLLFGDA